MKNAEKAAHPLGHRPASSFFLLHSLRQAAALHQLHAEVVPSLVLPDFVDGHDVGMIEMRGGFSLGTEPGDFVFICEFPGADELERDGAVQAQLSRAEDHAHPAAADFALQLVIAQPMQALPVRRAARTGRRLDDGQPEPAIRHGQSDA